jgi:FMN phosphatase YigB (HAD superfamily)
MAAVEPKMSTGSRLDRVNYKLKTLIAFDLHHVVVRPNRLSMLLSVVLFPHMFHVVFYLLFHPRALIGLIIELFTFQHPEKILRDSRISKYQQLIDWLSPLFENIVNSQELNHDVVRIIDELKGYGHEVVLFSNIGEEHLEKLVERLPVMKVKFDGFHATSKELNYHKKKQMTTWNNFMKKFDLIENKRNVFLIDDKPRNIAVARQCEFDGIVYKNPTQLREELVALQLLK